MSKIKEKGKKLNEAQKKFWSDFKAFIMRGSVLDLAVGVVIGGAFNAIVTALTNILLSVCTWAVPGGLKGLVTVLPAVNESQAGMNAAIGLDQEFAAADLQALAKAQAVADYGADVVEANPNLVESVKTTILGKYTLHGTNYFYNGSALIDWGTFINAIISFLIIGFTLFVIIRVVRAAEKKTKEMREKAIADIKAKEAKDEPAVEEEVKAEEPAPAPAPAPAAPANIDVLIEIRDELKKLNAAKEVSPAEEEK